MLVIEMIKYGELSFKTQWGFSFYHRITVVKNAGKNTC